MISCPAELLKIRSQSKTSGKTDYVKLARTLVQQQGPMSLYKGYLSTLIRDIPSFAIYFGIFEIGLRHYTKPTDSLTTVLSYQLLFGSLAGIASWWITYPFDVIKTTIQVSDKNLTIRKVIAENYKKQGWGFFFRGIACTSLKAVPMEATCLILYSQTRELI